jgi:hypothetical protein
MVYDSVISASVFHKGDRYILCFQDIDMTSDIYYTSETYCAIFDSSGALIVDSLPRSAMQPIISANDSFILLNESIDPFYGSEYEAGECVISIVDRDGSILVNRLDVSGNAFFADVKTQKNLDFFCVMRQPDDSLVCYDKYGDILWAIDNVFERTYSPRVQPVKIEVTKEDTIVAASLEEDGTMKIRIFSKEGSFIRQLTYVESKAQCFDINNEGKNIVFTEVNKEGLYAHIYEYDLSANTFDSLIVRFEEGSSLYLVNAERTYNGTISDNFWRLYLNRYNPNGTISITYNVFNSDGMLVIFDDICGLINNNINYFYFRKRGGNVVFKYINEQ